MLKTVHRSVFCGLIAVALAMGGCEKKPEPDRSEPGVMVMSVVRIAPRPALVLPARQAGLWETSVHEDGSDDVQTLQICIDAVTDARLSLRGTDLGGDRCGPRTVSRLTPESWKVLTTCTIPSGGTEAFSATITGDPVTAYSMKLRVQTTGSAMPQMNRATSHIIESKRLGDCKPGQMAGDVINAGVTVNLFEMEGQPAPAVR